MKMKGMADKSLLELHLRELCGLRLALARRAASMRVFHFGEIRAVDASRKKRDGTVIKQMGSIGEYGLHLQCPWRIDGPENFFVSHRDVWRKSEGTTPPDWDYESGENLQDKLIAQLLQGTDLVTNSSLNITDLLVIESVVTNDLGDFTLYMTGSYRLTSFVDTFEGESWRFMKTDIDEWRHLVFEGGQCRDGWLIRD